jgi:HEAT repeat protein
MPDPSGAITAADLSALVNDPLTPDVELADAVERCDDPHAMSLLLTLADHVDGRIRRAVAVAIPAVLRRTAVPEAAVTTLIRLSRDPDEDVRDWACFALGVGLSGVDTQALRDALAERIADPHVDTRCEALRGLARRRDARALPVVRQRLAGPDVWLDAIRAAGALGDVSLHTPLRARLDGWGDQDAREVCAALRLTDPDGLGEDLIDGLAQWYAEGGPDRTEIDQHWWTVARTVLGMAPHRTGELSAAVRARLAGNDEACARVQRSLGSIAGQHRT